MTAEQAAQVLGVSAVRVRWLARKGRLAGAEKLGRDWIIPRVTVERYKARPVGWPKGRKRKE